jgi:DNA mismatch repair protein MutL
MTIDPARIDVNIHPTKTEIKFDDEKSIYAIIRVSVKHALGQFNIVPTIDFEREAYMTVAPLKPGEAVRPPNIVVNPNFNPFAADDARSGTSPKPAFGSGFSKPSSASRENWEALFKPETETQPQQIQIPADWESEQNTSDGAFFQLAGGYVAKPTKAGLLLIHQNRAHQRILYERFLRGLENHSGASQQLLFPQQLNLPAGDIALLHPYFDDLRQLGFDVEPFGQNHLVVQGIPLALEESESLKALEEIIEDIKNNNEAFVLNKNHQLALVLARNAATRPTKALAHEEMLHLADQLFACHMPQYCPNGRPVMATLGKEELDKLFS